MNEHGGGCRWLETCCSVLFKWIVSFVFQNGIAGERQHIKDYSSVSASVRSRITVQQQRRHRCSFVNPVLHLLAPSRSGMAWCEPR